MEHLSRVFQKQKKNMKRMSSITQFKTEFLIAFTGCRRVLMKMPAAIPSLFHGPEMLSSVSYKAKLFPEDFSKNCNLDDSCISLPVSLYLRLHNISVTPKMVK